MAPLFTPSRCHVSCPGPSCSVGNHLSPPLQLESRFGAFWLDICDLWVVFHHFKGNHFPWKTPDEGWFWLKTVFTVLECHLKPQEFAIAGWVTVQFVHCTITVQFGIIWVLFDGFYLNASWAGESPWPENIHCLCSSPLKPTQSLWRLLLVQDFLFLLALLF